MKKTNLKSLIIQVCKNKSSSMLGVGPMSTNVIKACFESAKENNYPLMFIASRNQIDLKKFGGGYVNGWDQYSFVENIKKVADDVDFHHYYICRDHGGPWQRDEERNAHLPLLKAMNIAKESFLADIDSGFNLLMIDPTKDPFIKGKTVPVDFVINKTIELIEFCELERKRLNKPEILYEVGTEETNGGLTTVKEYDFFLKELNKRLVQKSLPLPIFAVGQTGTLVKSTRQAGKFNLETARKISEMAATHNVYLKEHNGDYLDSVSLLEHRLGKVDAVNVAPQFGTEETKAYLELCEIEHKLKSMSSIDNPSKFKDVILRESIATRRWEKWVSEEQSKLSIDEIIDNSDLSKEILEIAGHYTLNKREVIAEKQKLYNNLSVFGINCEAYVISKIKLSLQHFINGLMLKDTLIS